METGTPAKTVIVAEADGRERHYHADSWDASRVRPADAPTRPERDDYALTVIRSEGPLKVAVAVYPPKAWLSVRDADAEAVNRTQLALDAARKGLEEVLETVRVTPLSGSGEAAVKALPLIREIARRALNDTDTEDL